MSMKDSLWQSDPFSLVDTPTRVVGLVRTSNSWKKDVMNHTSTTRQVEHNDPYVYQYRNAFEVNKQLPSY